MYTRKNLCWFGECLRLSFTPQLENLAFFLNIYTKHLFLPQTYKRKEEMFRVSVEKKGEILKLRGEAELEAFAKPTKILSCVNDIMLVHELVDKRLFVVHQVKKNKRFEVPIALRGEDDSFALVHTGKDHLILHLWESGMGPVGCQVMNLTDYYRTGSMCWVDHGVDQVDLPFSLNVNDTCSYWFVGSRYMVEFDGGSMQIIRRPTSNTCYMLEDDYSLKQFEILKECPSMKGLCTHACMSIVVNTKNKGIFKTKVVLEEPMETPSLFFHVVPKVIFGGRHVILFRRKEGNTVYNHLRLRQGR
ncbi:hypothetical protein Tco_0633532 [Tanacetum coccineum]